MAKLTDSACNKHNLSFSEGIALLAISATTEKDYESLAVKGFITKFNITMQALNKKYSASGNGLTLAEELLADSEESVTIKEDDIKELAEKLRSIYPEGKMAGTSYYYRCNKADIIRKLKSFFRRYGEYTSEQIIEATQRYINSFNGNYTYLRLLKYFIWKDEKKDGEVLSVSQLADWIENKNETNITNSDWVTQLK